MTVIKTKNGYVEFDWATGIHSSEFTEGRNLDEIACELQRKLDTLLQQKTDLDKRFEELCLEEEILRQAIAETQDSLADLEVIAHPFKE